MRDMAAMSEHAATVDRAASNRVIDWGGTVTSMRLELGRELDPAEAKVVLAAEFWTPLPEFLDGRR